MGIGKYNFIMFVYRKIFKAKKFLFFPAVFLISFLSPFLYCLFTNKLFKNELVEIGFLNDYTAFISVSIIGIPLLCIFIVYYCEYVSEILNKLRINGIVNMTHWEHLDYIEKYCKKYNSKYKLIFLILIPAFFINAFWLLPQLSDNKIVWWSAYLNNGIEFLSPIGYVAVFGQFVYFYLIFSILYYIFITMSALRDLVQNEKINIRPIHPDEYAGLSVIGRLSLLNTIPIIIVGAGIIGEVINLIFVLKYFKLPIYLLLMIAGYFILVPFLYLFLLIVFHRFLKRSRKDHLEHCSELFSEEFNSGLMRNRPNQELLNKMGSIISVYRFYKDMPVWPINTGFAIGFCTEILIPIIFIVITSIVDVSALIG